VYRNYISRKTRRGQRGAGKLKAIIWTALLVFLAYAAFKIMPIYIAEYQLADKIQEEARFAIVNHYSEEQIRDAVYKVVQDLDIPVARDQIKVLSSSQLVQISLDYTVPVDLIVYRVDLHFTPSGQNRSLILVRPPWVLAFTSEFCTPLRRMGVKVTSRGALPSFLVRVLARQ